MDLSTLQYPRHLHKDGAYRIVADASACDRAMDEGWTLSPGDQPRQLSIARDESAVLTEQTPRPKGGRPRKEALEASKT